MEELKNGHRYRNINFGKLKAALMNIQSEADLRLALDYITNHQIKELENKSMAIYNLAFYFYHKIGDSKATLQFLTAQNTRKQKGFQINFDPEYALNICEKKEYDLVGK